MNTKLTGDVEADVASADAEDLALSLSPQFEAILARSQKRLEAEGELTSDEVRLRLGIGK
jgi:hypothetical protein